MRLVTALSAGALGVTVLLSGCAAGGAADPTTPTDSAPVEGGDATYALQGFPACLDVAQSIFNSTAGEQVVDNLLAQDMETSEPAPYLATSYDIEEEGKRFVLHLRDDVTFSNGEKFDAEVVKANFDNIIELGPALSSLGNTYLSGYVGTEVVDEYTAAVTFSAPKAGFPEALAEKTLGMVAPESLAESPEDRCVNGVIGSGPFVISDVVQDQKIVLSKRDDYNWPSDLADHDGAALLDTVTFQAIPEQSVRTGSLVSGQVDMIPQIGPADIDQLAAADATLEPIFPGDIVPTMIPNLNGPITGDLAVRQAIQIGIDRQELVDTLFTEYDEPATSVLGKSVPYQADLSDSLTFDPDAAAAILDDAGWVLGADGTRSKDGVPLEFSVMFSWAPYGESAELMQQQLADLGITVTLDSLSYAEYTDKLAAGSWDFLFTNSGTSDPDVLLRTFDSEFSSIFAAFPQADLDAALVAQSTEVDPAKRTELAAAVQELIVDQGYGIPTVDNTWIYALSPDLHGVTYTVPGMPVFYGAWKS
jgi:peptide/nickel transport system substrate-binding protein